VYHGAGLAVVPGIMEAQRITADDVKRRIDSGEAIAFVDTRADEVWRKAELQIPGSIRVPPEKAEAYLDHVPRRGLVVPYCT
jgi:hypothetical protein